MPTSTATAEQTAAHLEGSGLAHAALGRTGLTVSQAGFGCYRITPRDQEHRRALELALTSGINLVDTSSIYNSGGSEQLVGEVLAGLFQDGRLERGQVVVVTKGGFLQGDTYRQSQKRKEQGDPWPELVEFQEGLEQCLHPDFLAGELEQSRERLGLEALDVYLLHNPEYYLAWAAHEGRDLQDSRRELLRRIRQAFVFLEEQVRRGSIAWYGISSNNLGHPPDHAEFICLQEVWELAGEVAGEHHFGVVELALNLLEPGVAVQANQPGGQTVLEFARSQGLGVLANRPFNAVGRQGFMRLADLEAPTPPGPQQIMELMGDLLDSEERFRKQLYPNLPLPDEQRRSLAEQLDLARPLAAHLEEFFGLEHWRAVRSSYWVPRINGALNHLAEYLQDKVEGMAVLQEHAAKVQAVLDAVDAWQQALAAEWSRNLKQRLGRRDPDLARAGSLSRMALRALRMTQGVDCVLVGMRRQGYVREVLEELAQPVEQGPWRDAWLDLEDDPPGEGQGG